VADREPAVWRLGVRGGAVSLVWTRSAVEAPFAGRPLWTTPVPFGDRAVVLDQAGAVYLVEPRTGRATRAGALPAGASYALAEPVVHDQTLLVVADRTLHALRLPDGRPLWRFDAAGSAVRPPTVAGGTVLWTTQRSFEATSTTGRLYALDLATGQPRWSVALPSLWMAAEPAVRDGVVYLGTPPSAWDLASGRMRWSSPLAPSAAGAPALVGDRLAAAAVDVATGMGVVLGLDAPTGRLRWRAPLGAGEIAHPGERLWVAGDVIVVASHSGQVVGLDAATGRERWRHAPTAPRFGAITVDRGRVLFLQRDGRLVELDAASGTPTAHATGLDALLPAHARLQRPYSAGDQLLVATGQALFGFTVRRP
jgi:outer membrane protein assembly factor BamB